MLPWPGADLQLKFRISQLVIAYLHTFKMAYSSYRKKFIHFILFHFVGCLISRNFYKDFWLSLNKEEVVIVPNSFILGNCIHKFTEDIITLHFLSFSVHFKGISRNILLKFI